MEAFAAALQLGPPGLVLAPIAAGATAAYGAAQVAAIVAQPAPKFHAGLAPDEVPATLTRGTSRAPLSVSLVPVTVREPRRG